MLKKLTEKYISAFNKKDINEVANLLNDNFILEPTYITYENLNKELEKIKDYKIITNNQDKVEVTAKIWETYNPDIVKIVDKYKNKEELNPHAVNPNYLKLTEAEESRNSC